MIAHLEGLIKMFLLALFRLQKTSSELTAGPLYIPSHFSSYGNIDPAFFKFILKMIHIRHVGLPELPFPDRIYGDQIYMAGQPFQQRRQAGRIRLPVVYPRRQAVLKCDPAARQFKKVSASLHNFSDRIPVCNRHHFSACFIIRRMQ